MFYDFSLHRMKPSVQKSTLARLKQLEEEVRSLKETVAQQKDELHAGEMECRRLHNTIQELKASVARQLHPARTGGPQGSDIYFIL